MKLFLLFTVSVLSYSDNCKGYAAKCNSLCKWLQDRCFIHFCVLLSIHSFNTSQGVIILELVGDASYFHMVLKTHCYSTVGVTAEKKKIWILVTLLPLGKIMVKSLQNHAYTLPCIFTTFLHTKCTLKCMSVQFRLCFTCIM